MNTFISKIYALPLSLSDKKSIVCLFPQTFFSSQIDILFQTKYNIIQLEKISLHVTFTYFFNSQ